MGAIESLILYVAVAIISTACFSLHKNDNIFIRRSGILLSILVPSFVAGIRYNVGTDYPNYYWTFGQLKGVSYSWILTNKAHFNMDRGFLLLSKFFCQIFDIKVVFGIWGAIIIAIFITTLYGYCKDYDTTIIFFNFMILQYYDSFNILRQFIAVCIVLTAIKYVFIDKPFKYFALVAIAAIVHFSAVIAIPIWFLWNHTEHRAISFTGKWFVLLGAFLFATLWQRIIPYLSAFNIASIIKYSGYLAGNEHTNMSFLIKFVLTIVFFGLQNTLQKEDSKIGFFILLFSIGMLIDCTGYYSSFVKRCSLYYSIGEVILFSRLSELVTDNSKNIARFIIAAAALLYFVIGVFVLRQGGLIPFSF